MNTEFNLSEGNVFKRLLAFALPLLLSNLVQSLYNIADMLIVGNFGSAASMSGVNIGGQVTFVLTNVAIGLCVGATVLIGQYVGRGDRESRDRIIATTITILLIASIVITIVTLVFRDGLLRLIQTPAESYDESKIYLTVTVSGLVFIFGYNALAAILRGMGDSKRPFWFVTAACALNVVLSLLFVGAFRWGAFGAAIGTVISQAFSVLLCINYMARTGSLFNFKPSSYKIHGDQLRKLIKVGLPTCVQNTIVSVSFLFLTAIVNVLSGDSAVPSAAVGAVGKFNSFAFMPVGAMSAAIAAMSAQNIGANRLDRAVQTTRIGAVFSVVLMYAFFAFVQLFPETVVRLFTPEADVIAAGVTYIHAFAFDFMFIPFIFCINGLLIGGGHTMFTLITSIMSSVLLRVPVSYLFGMSMRDGDWLFGVGLGAPVASAGTLLIIIIFMFTGRWKVNAVKH